jgi:hypothetical protein
MQTPAPDEYHSLDIAAYQKPAPPLQRELATYERLLPELKFGHLGRYALIKGDDLVSIHDAWEHAIKAGCAQFELGSFIVKEIGQRSLILIPH